MRSQKNTTQNCTINIIPSAPWRVSSVHPLSGYCLEVTFLDGTKGKVDLSQLVTSKNAGVFGQLHNLKIFNQVYVEYGAVTWPGEIDLAPDAMYAEIKRHHTWVIT